MSLGTNTRRRYLRIWYLPQTQSGPKQAIELGEQVSFDLALLKRSNIDWMICQWNNEWDQKDEALRTKCFIKTLNLLKYVQTEATKQ